MSRRASHLSLLLLGALMLLSAASAQAQDVKKEHSAKKAGYLSILPGAGQVYNGKWWKVPIIYAGFGGLGYLAYSNYSNYRTYLTAYKIKTGNLEDGGTPSELELQLSEYYQASQLQSYKDSYRRDFELFCIITAAWYGLNIVDAIVDGHLYTYDISDDLSLSIDPCLQPFEDPYLPTTQYTQVGLSFNLHLK